MSKLSTLPIVDPKVSSQLKVPVNWVMEGLVFDKYIGLLLLQKKKEPMALQYCSIMTSESKGAKGNVNPFIFYLTITIRKQSKRKGIV